MVSQYRIRAVLAGTLSYLLVVLPVVQAAGDQALGRVVAARATTLRGVAVPASETVLSGDVLTTAGEGNALVELSAGSRVKVARSTSVRFIRADGMVQAELLSGALVTEAAAQPSVAVVTSKYTFEASGEGNSRYVVGLEQKGMAIAAIKGDLLVKTRDGSGTYRLREGKYATIDASASGVPSGDGQTDQTSGGGAQSGGGGFHIGPIPPGWSVAILIGAALAAGVGVAAAAESSSPSRP